jgi:hypothetical protein
MPYRESKDELPGTPPAQQSGGEGDGFLISILRLHRRDPMKMLTNEFAARPALIRHAIDEHTEWIEESLGLPLSQAVIVGCDMSFMDAAIPKLLGRVACRDSREEPVRVLTALLESVKIPPSCAPMLQAGATSRTVNLEDALNGVETRHPYSLNWDDGPVAFHVRGIPSPVIALSVSYWARAGKSISPWGYLLPPPNSQSLA